MSTTTSSTSSSSLAEATSASSFSVPPPPPPPPYHHDDTDDHEDDHEDSSQSSTSSKDDEHHSSTSHDSSTTATSTAVPTTLATSTIAPVSGTTTLTSNAASRTGNILNDDSTPLNEPIPSLETKASSSPMATGGIVLAAVFGFVAVVTIAYLLWRLIRRRREYRSANFDSSRRQRTSTRDALFEKDFAEDWPSATQETGIIFGRHSPAAVQPLPVQQGRGRFSFLNRRWYSTGSEVTARPGRNQYTASSTPRRVTPFLGLGLRSSHASSEASTSTTALNDTYTSTFTGIQRNASQRSTGSGHARAYAHHHVRPPRSVARSAISSISSRWIKRRSDDTTMDSAGEASDLYQASPTIASRRGTREAQMPRLPLPIAVVSPHPGTRVSI